MMIHHKWQKNGRKYITPPNNAHSDSAPCLEFQQLDQPAVRQRGVMPCPGDIDYLVMLRFAETYCIREPDFNRI